ncbi:hypothetical protein KKA53_00945 [Candidatus Dependentiae bacterium]|nr:hypothetical protein [Candidatus Dependentiae bacterium]
MRKPKAFVLLFALSILSLVTILTHQLLRTVYVGWHFDRAMVDREHAEMLALGGINLAIAQLTVKKKSFKKTEFSTEKKLSQEELAKKNKQEFNDFLQRVLPHMNRWQLFSLDKAIDGIDGELKFCISCENGKININEAFDFQKQEFKPIYKKFLERLTFRGKEKSAGQFLKNLTKYLTKRNKKIEDISQLYEDTDSSVSELFYEPPQRTIKVKAAKPNNSLTVQDIFTIWSNSETLEALFLSDALCGMLGLRRPHAYDAQTRKEKFKEFIKSFDPGTDQNTEKYWNMVNPLYEAKNTAKIKDLKIFSSKFEPKVYSVLSSGKVGKVEQRLLAIIEKVHQEKEQGKNKTPDEKPKQENKDSAKDQAKTFRIVRLYWI